MSIGTLLRLERGDHTKIAGNRVSVKGYISDVSRVTTLPDMPFYFYLTEKQHADSVLGDGILCKLAGDAAGKALLNSNKPQWFREGELVKLSGVLRHFVANEVIIEVSRGKRRH